MPVARHAKPPKHALKPRKDVRISSHSTIDAALKDLRACSRQLAPVLSSMDDELRILERLFYKGKNQHRLALFWRKVEEMRRFGKRIVEMRLLSLLDDLRFAFYEENGERERNPSVLKKAWTRIPDVKYLTYVLGRVHGACSLLAESRKRFIGVNRSLLLIMQTGAFLQFIVCLTAIVSRLDALCNELQEPCALWMKTVQTLVSVTKGEKLQSELQVTKLIEAGSSEPESRPEELLDENLREDLGSAVLREDRETEVLETSSLEKESTSLQESASSRNINIREGGTDAELSADAVFESLQQQIIPSQAQTVSKKQDSIKEAAGAPSKRRAEDGSQPGAKVKKKKKKDAIDDIFGGL